MKNSQDILSASNKTKAMYRKKHNHIISIPCRECYFKG